MGSPDAADHSAGFSFHLEENSSGSDTHSSVVGGR